MSGTTRVAQRTRDALDALQHIGEGPVLVEMGEPKPKTIDPGKQARDRCLLVRAISMYERLPIPLRSLLQKKLLKEWADEGAVTKTVSIAVSKDLTSKLSASLPVAISRFVLRARQTRDKSLIATVGRSSKTSPTSWCHRYR